MAKGSTQTQAALQSYECGTLPSAKSLASQLMAKPEISLAITELMQEAGLTKRYRLNKLRQIVDIPPLIFA